MIKNVVLDIGNVLADFRWKGLMEDLGFSKEAIEHLKAGVLGSPLWNELDRGVMNPATVVEMFKKNNPAYVQQIDTFFLNIEEIVEQFDYTENFIKELKDKGYQVYILSNYPGHIFSIHEKTKYSFFPYVDGRVISGYVKMVKPDRDIYEYLMDTYNLNPEECVFLDDREDNVKAALDFGMKGIVFSTYKQAREELEKIIKL